MTTRATYLESVSVTATDVAAAGGDKIGNLLDGGVTETGDMVEQVYVGGSQYKGRAATTKDTSGDLSFHFDSANAPQNLIRANVGNGTTLYFTFTRDSSASAGSKGKRVPMLVTEWTEKLASGGLVVVSVKLVGNGAPTAV